MQSYQSAQNESILERHIKFNRKSAGTRCLPVFGDETANSGSSCKHFFFFLSIFLSLMGKRLFGSMTAELHNPFKKNFKCSPVYYLLNYVPPKGSGAGGSPALCPWSWDRRCCGLAWSCRIRLSERPQEAPEIL